MPCTRGGARGDTAKASPSAPAGVRAATGGRARQRPRPWPVVGGGCGARGVIRGGVEDVRGVYAFRPAAIGGQVRVARKESQLLVGQVLPTVAGTRVYRKKSYFFADGGFNAVRNCEAG